MKTMLVPDEEFTLEQMNVVQTRPVVAKETLEVMIELRIPPRKTTCERKLFKLSAFKEFCERALKRAEGFHRECLKLN